MVMNPQRERTMEPDDPDSNALNQPNGDAVAAGDSSPYETVPSGEKHEAAEEPQQAPVCRENSGGA